MTRPRARSVATLAPRSTPAFAERHRRCSRERRPAGARRDDLRGPLAFSRRRRQRLPTPPLIARPERRTYADGDRWSTCWTCRPAPRDGAATRQRRTGDAGHGDRPGHADPRPRAAGSSPCAARGAPPQPGPADSTPAPVDLGPPARCPARTTHAHVNAAHTAAINLSDPAPPLKRRWRIWIDARQADRRRRPGVRDRPDRRAPEPDDRRDAVDVPAAGAKHAAYDRGRLFIANEDRGPGRARRRRRARSCGAVNRGTAGAGGRRRRAVRRRRQRASSARPGDGRRAVALRSSENVHQPQPPHGLARRPVRLRGWHLRRRCPARPASRSRRSTDCSRQRASVRARSSGGHMFESGLARPACTTSTSTRGGPSVNRDRARSRRRR